MVTSAASVVPTDSCNVACMDTETRQKICQLVAGIIISDDILDETEEKFIDRGRSPRWIAEEKPIIS